MLNAFKAAGRFITRHAATIASVCFTTGNIALAVKAGLHPDFDTAAGLLFIAHSMSLFFTDEKYSDKIRNTAYRCAGAMGLLATACLSAKGIDFKEGHVLDTWRVFSPIVGFGVTSTYLLFQKEISQWAKSATASKNALKRALAFTQQYPVACAAIVDSIGIAGLTRSIADWPMSGIIVGWGVGEVGFFLSDPRLQERILGKPSSASVQPSPS